MSMDKKQPKTIGQKTVVQLGTIKGNGNWRGGKKK